MVQEGLAIPAQGVRLMTDQVAQPTMAPAAHATLAPVVPCMTAQGVRLTTDRVAQPTMVQADLRMTDLADLAMTALVGLRMTDLADLAMTALVVLARIARLFAGRNSKSHYYS